MAAFNGSISCDGGGYTAASVLAALRAGSLPYRHLYGYAGYGAREGLVRSCMTVDSTPGSPTAGGKVDCGDDTWWGNATTDIDYGACHTLNPCHGFPVGARCASAADCLHATDHSLAGAACGPAGPRGQARVGSGAPPTGS